MGSPILISVLTNDDVDLVTNPTTESLTITAATKPAHGSTTISSDFKKITYTPDLNYFSAPGAPDARAPDGLCAFGTTP